MTGEFQGGDEDRAALIYFSRARSLFIGLDEATGRELATGKTPEAVSFELFERCKALSAAHCYLLVVRR